MAEPTVPPMRPEPERDGWGRYLLTNPDNGNKRGWTRVSTLAKCMADEYHLTLWKRRTVALGLVAEPGLLAEIAAAGAELDAASETGDRDALRAAKERLNELCDLAHDAAGGNRGSDLGTALHSLTEWFDAGRLAEVEYPAELESDLLAYSDVMADEGIERPAEWIERIVVNSVVDCAGTFDRILVMPEPCSRCGKTLRIGDLKTQKTLDFGYLDIAIQLATYAHADYMIHPETGDPEPLPDVCQCIAVVMWLPVGKARCTLHEIDIARGWEFAMLGRDVRAARSAGKSLGRPYSRQLMKNAGAISDHLAYLIRNAVHPDALVGLWRDAASRGEWTDAHTRLAAERKAALLAGVSA